MAENDYSKIQNMEESESSFSLNQDRGDSIAAPLPTPTSFGFVEAIEQRYPVSVLETLLKDRTTGRNIIWADDEYEALGEGYMGDDEITVDFITGLRSGVIKPRIAKVRERQSQRTRSRAEVFTPSWLCNQMNNHLDAEWFGREGVFNTETERGWIPTTDSIEFSKTKGRGWTLYVASPRLEITCGEAPFICSRYDTVTGESLPVPSRIGFLDRKLRVAAEKSKTYKEWLKWSLSALKSTYGYEYQGDNLVIARINVLETFVEHTRERWGHDPSLEEVKEAAHIISWNLWQMDGLACTVPTDKAIPLDQQMLPGLGAPEPETVQFSLFDFLDDEPEPGEPEEIIPLCVIYDWDEDTPKTYASLRNERMQPMKKFFAVIGNPPYQESDGGNEASASPLYHRFVQESQRVAERVTMVTPSRWFSGGKGLDAYREEMISSHHLKKLVDFPKLYEPFPNVKIRGGVSYFAWDESYDGSCKVQTIEDGKPISAAVERYLDTYDVLVRRNEAVPILDKVLAKQEPTLDKRISARKPFGLPTNYHGPSSPEGLANPIKLYESQREGWISRSDITIHQEWIDSWKVLLNRVQGTSAAVETKFLSNPKIASPNTACTETYLVAGRFDTEQEAEYFVSYLKTRFVRFLISLRKVSQDAARGVYSFVPDLQYNHPWSDRDLYDRYGIESEEIAYIESIVQEMD